jgi:hypothetical protein
VSVDVGVGVGLGEGVGAGAVVGSEDGAELSCAKAVPTANGAISARVAVPATSFFIVIDMRTPSRRLPR